MSQGKILHDFYQRQKEANKKIATHVKRDSKTNEILMYYILKEVKYNDNTSRIRPQYLDCWGSYSFHSKGKRIDEQIIESLEKIN